MVLTGTSNQNLVSVVNPQGNVCYSGDYHDFEWFSNIYVRPQLHKPRVGLHNKESLLHNEIPTQINTKRFLVN